MVASLISGSGLSRLTESEAPVPTQIRHRVLDLARWTYASGRVRQHSSLVTACGSFRLQAMLGARSGGGSVDSLAQANRTID
jgi:hypothetical protein